MFIIQTSDSSGCVESVTVLAPMLGSGFVREMVGDGARGWQLAGKDQSGFRTRLSLLEGTQSPSQADVSITVDVRSEMGAVFIAERSLMSSKPNR